MLLTCPEHVDRARYHRKAGDALFHAARHQWSAVCYFYSAYHLARGALRDDPIFSNLGELKQVNDRLIPDDRFAEKHQMRRGSEKNFGVNDLVELIYPEIAVAYAELHGASVAVRYEQGTSIPVGDLAENLEDIEQYLIAHDRLTTLREELERI